MSDCSGTFTSLGGVVVTACHRATRFDDETRIIEARSVEFSLEQDLRKGNIEGVAKAIVMVVRSLCSLHSIHLAKELDSRMEDACQRDLRLNFNSKTK